MDMATKIIADSAFGCAGQRCLAVSLAVTVGESRNQFVEMICDAAASRKVGYGLDDGIQMGPVINQLSKSRVEQLIGIGASEGSSVPVDGRGTVVKGYEGGSFVRPTILMDVKPGSEMWKTEIFGPVLSLMHVDSIDDAIALANSHMYGNQASLFTSSGNAARRFRYEADAGNIGINIGVAAPMAFFPFSGWRKVSLAICTVRAWTRSSSLRRKRWLLSAGRRNGRGNSKYQHLRKEDVLANHLGRA